MTTPDPNSVPDPNQESLFQILQDRSDPQYDIVGMAKELYTDAGLEWPDWVDDPSQLKLNEGNGSTNGNDPGISNSIPPQTNPVPNTQETPAANQLPSTVVKIGTREIPVSQGEALLQWHDWLSNNPDKAQDIVKVIRGEPLPAAPTMVDPTALPKPAVQPPTVPEGFDLETPRDKYLFEQLQQIREGQSKLNDLANQQQEQLNQARIAQKAREDTSYAVKAFQSKHNLSDTEVESVRAAATDLNLVGGLVARDPQHAPQQILKALEAAMWQIEPIRNKLLNVVSTQPTTPSSTDQDRQRKLSALSGSTGSTPRTESRPRLDSDRDMKDAVARFIETLSTSQ